MSSNEEKRRVPHSMEVESFHYVVHNGQIYKVGKDDFDADPYLLPVDEIPDEYHERWDDDE